MPTLVLSGESLCVNLESRHLEIKRREEGSKMKRVTRVPLHDVDRVAVMGRPDVTVPVLQRLMKLEIPVCFLTHYGRWIGALTPENDLNAARRILQYEKSKDRALALTVAQRLVTAKISNSRRALQRLAANRRQAETPAIREATGKLREWMSAASSARSLDVLRGYEGMAAGMYFSALSAFFPPTFPFNGRNRRPPKDPANALLSFAYTMLQAEIDAGVRLHGLDPCIGFLHEVSLGTPSLSVDLIEPLRAPVCDLMVLNMLNHGQFDESDFDTDSEKGGVFLNEEGRRKFFMTYETAMTRKFAPARDEPHTDFRQVIDRQVCAVLRALEGRDDYSFFKMP